MVMTLDTILECDFRCKDMVRSAKKGNIEIRPCTVFDNLQSILYAFPSRKELELCEPESELDPSSETPSPDVMLEQSKKSQNKRRPSLIDKALKCQQHEQFQDLHSDAQRQMEPNYIQVSDLAADWSRYIVKPVMEPSRDSASILMSMEDGASQAAIPALTKRHHKKSLIDKAASRQRREVLLSKLQEINPTKPQLKIPQNSKKIHCEKKPQTQAYCSLCEGRGNSSSCVLCSR